MKDLKIGDEIAVGAGVCEAVYSFGHHDPKGSAKLLEIETLHRPTALRISHQHLVFVQKSGVVTAIPAASLSIGDALLLFGNTENESEPTIAIVQSVKPVFSADGLYAPFTPSGKLLVNGGLLVSSFVALNNEEAVSFFGVKFTHHWLAHSFELPHRLFCRYKTCVEEQYTSAGISMWEAEPLKVALWWLDVESQGWKDLLFFGFLVLLGCFNALEYLLSSRGVILVLAGILCYERYFTSKKQGQQAAK